MRVLVTGSSGQLGAEIARQLARRGDDIVSLDLCAGDTTTHVGSVADAQLVSNVTRGADAIVHTASLHAAHINSHTAKDFVETNVNGTINLLDAAARNGVKRFVYTSTTSVYGLALECDDHAVWVTEDLPPQPRDIYDITKLSAEQLCAVAAREHGMACVSLRVSRFFPEAPRLMAVYRLYRGVDVRDAAAAHVLALDADLPAGFFDAFNVSARSPLCRDQVHRLKHHADRVLRAQFPWIEGAFERRDWKLPTSIDRVYVTEKAERVLRYRPEQGLVQYLQEFAPREEGCLF